MQSVEVGVISHSMSSIFHMQLQQYLPMVFIRDLFVLLKLQPLLSLAQFYS